MNTRGFVLGLLAGTAGIKVLSSREAKNVYAHIGAAVIHAREDIMETAQILRENGADIAARAHEINERSKAANKEAMIRNVYEKEEVAE